ncbi:MAG TPA: VOC family protein [Pyrinomonadaceae bacterium]|nr:VOC family protein [Pyrinomonadaceae bacterium]
MKSMKRLAISLLLAFSFVGSIAGDEVTRPRILGLAHMALFVSDLKKARAFYEDFLGYEEPYVLKRADGSDRIVFIKINDNQYIELFADTPRQDGHLNHISFFTDSIQGVRDYLASRGIKVPDKVGKGRIGNLNFNITDPDDHTVEIVQYEPDSWTKREQGRFMPDSRISKQMAHVGVTVGALEPALKFYRDILGFREFWRGSSSGTELSWVNMRVPDGDDYLELMLYSTPPDAGRMGSMNHICLFTPDIKKAVALLESRPARKSYTKPIEIKIGKNGKRQVNLFDPDGTRIELMEPNTVDGKVVRSSTARPPH